MQQGENAYKRSVWWSNSRKLPAESWMRVRASLRISGWKQCPRHDGGGQPYKPQAHQSPRLALVALLVSGWKGSRKDSRRIRECISRVLGQELSLARRVAREPQAAVSMQRTSGSPEWDAWKQIPTDGVLWLTSTLSRSQSKATVDKRHNTSIVSHFAPTPLPPSTAVIDKLGMLIFPFARAETFRAEARTIIKIVPSFWR